MVWADGRCGAWWRKARSADWRWMLQNPVRFWSIFKVWSCSWQTRPVPVCVVVKNAAYKNNIQQYRFYNNKNCNSLQQAGFLSKLCFRWNIVCLDRRKGKDVAFFYGCFNVFLCDLYFYRGKVIKCREEAVLELFSVLAEIGGSWVFAVVQNNQLLERKLSSCRFYRSAI